MFGLLQPFWSIVTEMLLKILLLLVSLVLGWERSLRINLLRLNVLEHPWVRLHRRHRILLSVGLFGQTSWCHSTAALLLTYVKWFHQEYIHSIWFEQILSLRFQSSPDRIPRYDPMCTHMLFFHAILSLSSCFRSCSSNRMKVHKLNTLFWDVTIVSCRGGGFVTG